MKQILINCEIHAGGVSTTPDNIPNIHYKHCAVHFPLNTESF